MCLAIPAKVVSIQDNLAKVDFGGGLIREVDISLVDAKVNDYVLVHAGYAIQVLSRDEAEETLRLWSEILEVEEKLERNDLR
ncbi:HypC/HybG/HupF family hydrogenase formation chaperone [Candidatus Bathyarchaeota archaeon]|nr:HypC/HybG/HupF family hydrogenase formation chaperone [Candidatus Bathyarchaeota archaeon]MBS7636653.1 HypC/HybG/HupF family hydrogenase formation chaperone [Candidatus Bathyarchaeota archaeon]